MDGTQQLKVAPRVHIAPERGLELSSIDPLSRVRNYVTAAIWALATCAAVYAAVGTLVPAPYLPALMVTGLGVGFLASLDARTHLVQPRHILTFGIVLTPLIAYAAIASGEGGPVVLRALGGAVGVFVFMLVLAVTAPGMGGGDVKLAPIPAAAFASVAPLAAVLWLWLTIAVAIIASLAIRLRARMDGVDLKELSSSLKAELDEPDSTGIPRNPDAERLLLPFVPCMAIGAVAAIPTYSWVMTQMEALLM